MNNKALEDKKINLEKHLTQSRKMEAIGTFAGGIAHDFNNILSAILGFTELAIHEIDNKEKLKAILDDVLVAGERAKELTRKILTFSRMNESEYNPIQLDQVMKESLRMLGPIIPSNVVIIKNINDSGYILSNPTQLNQILVKLCNIAIQSMNSEGGLIEIYLDRIKVEGPNNSYGIDAGNGPYLRITISDNGEGLPPEMQERIFEPYFATKENGSFAPLDLSVIYGIVKSHHGDIICRGNETGGTTFEIYLPEHENIKEKETPLPEVNLETGTGRILVIDDDQILVKLLEEMLSIMGYEAESNTSSKDGLKIFKDSPDKFDLVITDMTMPEMNGDALAREILSIRNNIPIILCSGFNEQISEAQAKEIGITEFLMKPVNMKTLSSVINKAMD